MFKLIIVCLLFLGACRYNPDMNFTDVKYEDCQKFRIYYANAYNRYEEVCCNRVYETTCTISLYQCTDGEDRENLNKNYVQKENF